MLLLRTCIPLAMVTMVSNPPRPQTVTGLQNKQINLRPLANASLNHLMGIKSPTGGHFSPTHIPPRQKQSQNKPGNHSCYDLKPTAPQNTANKNQVGAI